MNRYDYIIVGAGSAGCVLASRLSEDKHARVLVLEAGGKDNNLFMHMPVGFRFIWRGPHHNWNYESEPEPFLDGRRLALPRGKTLGGSSSINGMLYLRGHPLDYDQWRQLGNEGWSYADVLPYFKKSEGGWRGETDYHGASGPLGVSPIDTSKLRLNDFLSAAQNAGYPITDDINGANAEGFGPIDTTTKNGRRSSTAQAYLHPARGRANLTVEINAHTNRILIENGRAIGIEYVQDGQTKTAHADGEVILAGGAYNSPQLLMLSGIGPADELARHGIKVVVNAPGVGRNLQEHPITLVQFATKEPITYLNELRADKVAFAGLQWLLFGNGKMANQPLPGLGFVKTRPELDRPDVEIFVKVSSLDSKIWFPYIRPSPPHSLESNPCLLHPESRGEVTLRSADPNDKVRILFNMYSAESDRIAMRQSIRIIRDIYAQSPLAGLLKQETLPGPDVKTDAEIDAYVRASTFVNHHPVGTCKMGIDEFAVVDPQLRVRGVQGLRVVDASVMPLVPGGHTNAPTIMIAEKAADMIRGRTALPAADMPRTYEKAEARIAAH